MFSHLIMSHYLLSRGLQHASLPCPSLCPGVSSNSCALSQWYHPTTSSSVTPFSSYSQSFLTSRSFPMSQLFFPSGGPNIGASPSMSVLPMNIQGWFPLGLTGLMALLSKQLWRVFSNATVQNHQFFCIQPSLWSNSRMTTGRTIALTMRTFVAF